MPAPFLDWLAIINLLGVVQGFFLSVIFLSMRRGNRAANRLLGLLLLSMALLITDLFLSYTNYILYVPALINTTEAIAFWLGPLVYFYTRTLVGPPLHWRRDWLHLLPGLVQVVSRIPFYLQSNAYKVRDLLGAFHRDLPEALRVPPSPILWYPGLRRVGGLAGRAVVFLPVRVLRAGLRLIRAHTRRRGEPFWNASDVALRALPRLMTLFWCSWWRGRVYLHGRRRPGRHLHRHGLVGDLLRHHFLLPHHPELLHAANPRRCGKSTKSRRLAPEVAGSLKERLLGCMESEKPYLDSELTLAQLAEKLRTSTHHLSQLVNEGLGVNFADFINQYRIEAVKGKAARPGVRHLKIEEIAYQTGFNSKSTFQAAFKNSRA
jgi:AraC-like DNA-binding protein